MNESRDVHDAERGSARLEGALRLRLMVWMAAMAESRAPSKPEHSNTFSLPDMFCVTKAESLFAFKVPPTLT